MALFDGLRRRSWPVRVGNVVIGGDAPVRIQSMASTSTMDTEASVDQAQRIVEAGGEIVRFTAQGVREASNLALIREGLRRRGITAPLVADIHFNPNAAFEAARNVEKVRINPGNFVDPGRVFKHLEYTDEEYAAEQERIARTFVPFLDLCREHGTAIRIGVNHGSLSDRIMSRYGDTPAGMVESAMEYLRIAVAHDFKDIVISIKASNTVVMVETVHRLVKAMDAEDMHFPLHLGVTEAGDGDDGRIKSAVGIGTLLAHGIGDTIRVSLSEEPECEIPVAKALVDYLVGREPLAGSVAAAAWEGYDAVSPVRFRSRSLCYVGREGGQVSIGGDNQVVAVHGDAVESDLEKFVVDADKPYDDILGMLGDREFTENDSVTVYSLGGNPVASIEAAIFDIRSRGIDNPVIARIAYLDMDGADVVLRASADFGTLLLDAMVDGIDIVAPSMDEAAVAALERDILQAARCRFEKTEFISCPGCGRTLFDLQATVKEVKAAMSHLAGLKIAVMGCIVNGPGEMADADYGYVGAAAGKVSLYRGKECVERNINREDALEHLVALLKNDGKWVEADEVKS